MSVVEYLLTRVWFVDGSHTRQCRAGNATAAEVLMIHELLHMLGLGESPPSSGEITRRVRKRGGGA